MSKEKQRFYTKEQQEWRDSILGKNKRIDKIRKVSVPVKSDLPKSIEQKILENFYYMNNCVYWLNEYLAGNTTKERLRETALAMQKNATDLAILLTQETIKS